MARRRQKRKKSKRVITPAEQERRDQIKNIRGMFSKAGFKRTKIDGLEFTFKGRTGELDDIFVYENIVVLCEYTTGASGSDHLLRKKVLFDLISDNQAEWIVFLRDLSEEFKSAYGAANYSAEHYQVRTLYCPKHDASEELRRNCQKVFFMEVQEARYFQSLTKTIEKSARFELFKFFNIESNQIGRRSISAASGAITFKGHLLPEGYSNFPKGYKVVSFYADPATLLEKSFVLRKDSWRDPESLYQRMLIPKKIKSMRRYLSTKERVFVNNIIVSLASETQLNEMGVGGQNLAEAELKKVREIGIQIPDSYNTIGVIDGQHRIFCYHEGKDSFEEKVARLRDRQNLLVTGILYPRSASEEARKRFEASLFLEINDEQTRARSGLKQSIELILNPTSTIAVAKAVALKLARNGPLKGMLEAHFFDDKDKIKTTSIVSYGLRPLVKFSGSDSLFSMWAYPEKEKLTEAVGGDQYSSTAVLQSYIDYCCDKINAFLVAAKLSLAEGKWCAAPKRGAQSAGILTPTVINGLIVCLRELVKDGKTGSVEVYKKRLRDLDSFSFKTYKSSHWKKLGLKLASTYF